MRRPRRAYKAKPRIEWTDEQLQEVGINKKDLLKVMRFLGRASTLMWEMGLTVYGASSTGHLIHDIRPTHGPNGDTADRGSVVATIGEGFSGGDW